MLENPVGNRIPIGFLFDRSFIMITFVRGRSFCHGRVGGNEKGILTDTLSLWLKIT